MSSFLEEGSASVPDHKGCVSFNSQVGGDRGSWALGDPHPCHPPSDGLPSELQGGQCHTGFQNSPCPEILWKGKLYR